MQSISSDIDSIGGGFGSGFGGNNPLLWLITLGFLKGDNGILGGNSGSGVLAGEANAKLDCLAKEHASLQHQISSNNTDVKFASLASGIAELAGINRDSTAALTNTLNDIRAEAAECCCETKVAIQGVNTNIASQTAVLLASGKENTQRILDKMCDGEVTALTARNNELLAQVNKAEIIDAIGRRGGHG